MLLLYDDNVMFFAKTLEDDEKLMIVLEKFYMHNMLSVVNIAKTTIMFIVIRSKDKPCILSLKPFEN